MQQFESQLALIRDLFTALPLTRAVHALQRGELPRNAICVTFDDGYADNAEHALPSLQRFGVPATFFVSTGFLDGGCMFNDVVIEAVARCEAPALDVSGLGLSVRPLPLESLAQRNQAITTLLRALKHLEPTARDDAVREVARRCGLREMPTPMMSTGQVRQLADAGMEIGAHTVSHPILKAISDAEARSEIADGRQRLREISGQPVDVFAYPNGKPGADYARTHVEMVRALGFTAAVSTAPGCGFPGCDLYQLPRFTPWDRSPERFVVRLLSNIHQPPQGLV